MPRSVNSAASKARRKKVLKKAKGFYGKRKNVYTVAKNIVEKGQTYSYVGRKNKKRDYRALWIARINAAVRAEGLTYSEFIHKLSANAGRPGHERAGDLSSAGCGSQIIFPDRPGTGQPQAARFFYLQI